MPAERTARRDAWSHPQMWRLAGAINALRRTINDSKAIRDATALLRLERDYQRLQRRSERLSADAQRIWASGTPQHMESLTQEILRFYRDMGDLERTTRAKCVGS